MKRLSLRDRVTLASTGVLALALIVVSVVGNRAAEQAFRRRTPTARCETARPRNW